MKVSSIIKLQFLPKLLPFSKFSTNSSSNCLLIRFVVFEIIQNCGKVLLEPRIYAVDSTGQNRLDQEQKVFEIQDQIFSKLGSTGDQNLVQGSLIGRTFQSEVRGSQSLPYSIAYQILISSFRNMQLFRFLRKAFKLVLCLQRLSEVNEKQTEIVPET